MIQWKPIPGGHTPTCPESFPKGVVIDRRPQPTAEQVANANPCAIGLHRWAWLTSGGQACGHCGERR